MVCFTQLLYPCATAIVQSPSACGLIYISVKRRVAANLYMSLRCMSQTDAWQIICNIYFLSNFQDEKMLYGVMYILLHA